MPKLRFIHPQAARTRIAPVDGTRVPGPQAAGQRPGVVASPRIFEPVAPTAGPQLPAPRAGKNLPAPTAGLPGRAPANVAIAA